VPPPPPPTAFDRTYEVPVLGRPVAEGKSAGDSPGGTSRGVRPSQAGQRQTDPPRADDGGIPVTVRPQPDIVRSDAGIPVVVRPPQWHTPDGRPLAHVESFDLEIYTVRPGDTYASISQLRYRSDRYQQALVQFNRERDPRLAELRPGMIVYLPPAGYLERRYGVPAPPASAADVPPGLPAPGRSPPAPAPGTQERAVVPGRQAQPTPSPAAGAPAVHLPASPHPAEGQEIAPASWNGPAGGKRYRVRPQDTLWSIAKETLGSGDRWPEILRLNREQLPDAARLRPGMVLRLPDDARLDARDAPP
jgi:LysM repeat protein